MTAGGRDPNNEIGLGHIVRSINLASHLKGIKIWFIVKDYGGIKRVFPKKGFEKAVFLKKNQSLESDLKKIKNCIIKNNIDISIIDMYKEKTQYISELKKLSKVVVISDLNKINYSCDLIVNGFIGFKNKVTKNKFGTKCLLGPSYQILNKNFFKEKNPTKKRYNLIASFGGTDTKNLTMLLIKALLPKYINKIRTKIIIGPSNINKNQILRFKKQKNISLIQNPKNIYKEIFGAEFGICTGGITSYEFAAMNIPFAIICDVSHQLLTAKEWDKKGCARNLGKINKKTFSKLNKYLEDISKNKIKRPKQKAKLIDGYGATRVTKEILGLIT